MILNENLILNSLAIKNFATFKDQEIHFGPNFNAIVGETGSGKSLILDALQLILGNRADKKLVRKGFDFTSIEATFSCSDEKIKSFFDEQGYPFDSNEIIIKRIIYSNGKSKSFANYQTCNLSLLSLFSKRFIDLVGQFENQKLLSENYQLLLLDRFSNNYEIKTSFKASLKKFKELNNKLEQLITTNNELKKQYDFIKFQVGELQALNPSIEEEKDLIEKKLKFSNLEKISALSSELSQIINGNEDSDGILGLSKLLLKKLQSNGDLFDVKDSEKLEELLNWISELDYNIQKSANIEYDEEDIQHVIERLDLYQKIKRKYNLDTDGLINQWLKLQKDLDSIENLDQNIKITENKLEILKEDTYQKALNLHNSRIQASKKLSKILTQEINHLRMQGASIKIDLSESQLTENGISTISFDAQTNPGEGFFKIKDIASGGELSRILLALRKIVSGQDSISIFLFDEVDTGIGGETALCIGKALAKVSENSQVIAITHLPQIASCADKLILVDKMINQKESRTYSTIKEISGHEIKNEIKKMIPISQV